MSSKLLNIMAFLNWFFDGLMTAITVALVFIVTEWMYFVGLFLMISFWIGRLKREIDTFYDGSPIKYIRNWFTRKKKEKEE